MTVGVFAFGPYQLDPAARRLLRDGEPVALSGRSFDLLCRLVAGAGQILSKDMLIESAWAGVAVTDNSLEQAISGLRRTLGPRPDGAPYIETHARRGYRFTADVARAARRESDDVLESLLAPHRAWLDGRAALETLERDEIARARTVFERVLASVPDQSTAHVGLANACAMQFEMTRADPHPDRASLGLAVHHAREACRLDVQSGESWATLGFVLERLGQHIDALAAARRAVSLEPQNWRHQLRLAYTGWGEERLRAAQRTLSLLPGFPLAHWLIATVYVARGASGEAGRALDEGIASASRLAAQGSRFTAVALHWLRGLIWLADGDEAQALEHFERELALERGGHLYAREVCANTWYAIGAVRLRQHRRPDAVAAFEHTLRRVEAHPLAKAALAALQGAPRLATAADTGRLDDVVPVEAVFAAAVQRALAGEATEAARVVAAALNSAQPGSAGWILPVEPILNTASAPDLWTPVLAQVRARAA